MAPCTLASDRKHRQRRQVVAPGSQRFNPCRQDLIVEGRDTVHTVDDIRGVRADIAQIGTIGRLIGARTPLTACCARIMVEASRNCRGPWRGPGRLVVPLSHGTPIRPICTSPKRAWSMRHMGKPHEGRYTGKTWQVEPRHGVKKRVAHDGPPRRFLAVTGPSPCASIRVMAACMGS